MENIKNLRKNLYLVKMGGDYKNEGDMLGSDVCNYRIRGTFHDKDNNLIFIEFGHTCQYNSKEKVISRIKLMVHHQFNASKDWNENNSHIKIDYEELKAYNYTKKDILSYIYNKFGVKFDKLELIDCCTCDYDYKKIAGDKFEPDKKAIVQAEKIKDYFYNFEKEIEGKKYPNFSIYYENGKLTVLKHYNCYNDKIVINDIFKFDFNYKMPSKEVLENAKIQYKKEFGIN